MKGTVPMRTSAMAVEDAVVMRAKFERECAA
jgi:hypothetical protein